MLTLKLVRAAKLSGHVKHVSSCECEMPLRPNIQHISHKIHLFIVHSGVSKRISNGVKTLNSGILRNCSLYSFKT